MPRPVNKIAAEIDNALRDLQRNTRQSWISPLRPYVNAMLEMNSFDDWYGIDRGVDVGLRFLSNAAPWRGEQARRIKSEIQQLIKEAQNVPH
jgi:hypothetical protein